MHPQTQDTPREQYTEVNISGRKGSLSPKIAPCTSAQYNSSAAKPHRYASSSLVSGEGRAPATATTVLQPAPPGGCRDAKGCCCCSSRARVAARRYKAVRRILMRYSCGRNNSGSRPYRPEAERRMKWQRWR